MRAIPEVYPVLQQCFGHSNGGVVAGDHAVTPKDVSLLNLSIWTNYTTSLVDSGLRFDCTPKVEGRILYNARNGKKVVLDQKYVGLLADPQKGEWVTDERNPWDLIHHVRGTKWVMSVGRFRVHEGSIVDALTFV